MEYREAMKKMRSLERQIKKEKDRFALFELWREWEQLYDTTIKEFSKRSLRLSIFALIFACLNGVFLIARLIFKW